MAPELIEKRGVYNGAVADMWAVGVVFYSLLTGALPFVGKDEKIIAKKICEVKFKSVKLGKIS